MKTLKLESLKREFPFISELNKAGFNSVELDRLFEFYNDSDNKILVSKLDKDNFVNPLYFTEAGFDRNPNDEYGDKNIFTIDVLGDIRGYNMSNGDSIADVVYPAVGLAFIVLFEYQFWGGYEGDITRTLTIFKVKEFDFAKNYESQIESLKNSF